MNTVTIIIGWTKHDGPRDQMAYTPFWDGWTPGQAQHYETIEVTLPDVLEYPGEISERDLAEACFAATNAPVAEGRPTSYWRNGSVVARVWEAIQATGYRGEQAHYSLSVGDTVIINGAIWSCERVGWRKVGQVSPHITAAELTRLNLGRAATAAE
jgi:hypothetical protein